MAAGRDGHTELLYFTQYIYPARVVRMFMEDHPRPAGQGALGPLNTILQEGDDLGDD